MAKMRKSTGEYFTALYIALTRNDMWILPGLNDDATMERLRQDGHPLDLDRLEAALAFTANASLGRGHRMTWSNLESTNKTAGHLIHIVLQRIADHGGDPQQPKHDQLRELLSVAFGTFASAYVFGAESRGLRQFVQGSDSLFFCDEALALVA